ncbi:hypothetical protein KUTeg_012023 [Tegillarca granosa]|uniref:Fucosyltransferase n=1 Tax=Tegillarca granosa TaxID=220873 RepID=A0ABQ9EYD4_TEGGR|nr:hypothetical protein KUTeg_012023 [Tegillarca granosa]
MDVTEITTTVLTMIHIQLKLLIDNSKELTDNLNVKNDRKTSLQSSQTTGTVPESLMLNLRNNSFNNTKIMDRKYNHGNGNVLNNIWYASNTNDRIISQLNFRPTKNHKFTNTVQNILLDWGTGHWNVPEEDRIFHNLKCKVRNCKLLSNINGKERVNARLFNHNIIFVDYLELSKQYLRTKDEIWIIGIMESPNWTPVYQGLQNVFNWTATYRIDSTIPMPYFKWQKYKRSEKTKYSKINFAKGKTKKVAMFISHCDTVNQRLQYAQELGKYISVDIYGACGNQSCFRKNEKKCLEMLKNNYKFYLSFENIRFNEGIYHGKVDIWDANRLNDRILEQMKFKPRLVSDECKVIYLEQDFGVPEGKTVFDKEKCPVKNCLLTNDLKQQPEAHARLFKDVNNRYVSNAHKTRDQIWILFLLESPLATPNFCDLNTYLFNWTATYRIDSTIVAPYEKWEQHKSPTKQIANYHRQKNFALGKKKKVAIFVSNCFSKNDRLSVVKELAEHIDVEIYGGCGSKICSRDKADKCLHMLGKDYKFYLAFENSNCRDYITEKFFRNALMSDVLPVVMGAHPDDYRKVAPPNSYIHIEDFKSPKELAEYLHKLDKNDTLYNEYFKWKGTGSFINTKFWCRLCAMLNDPNKPELVVENMESWWRPPKNFTTAKN